MKLKGIEVAKYGPFEAQYLELRSGLTVISGKNNAGKSSLLLAVNSFVAPYSSWRYAGSPDSEIRLIATVEDDDPPFRFHDSGGVPQSPLKDGGRFIAFCYVLKESAEPAFKEARLLGLPTASIPLMEGRGPAGFQRNTLSSKGTLLHSTGVGRPIEDEFPFLQQLRQSLYLVPHRAVADNNQAEQQKSIPADGTSLSAYLHELRGSRPRIFSKIEQEFAAMFPEITDVITPMQGRNVSVALMKDGDEVGIPLTQSGTGLEQALVLLIALMDERAGRYLLIDEPQNFLHPLVERRIAALCQKSDRCVIVATHSPVFINSVEPIRLIHISGEGEGFNTDKQGESHPDVGTILHDLGYRNSDLLFFDRLIFVEGVSDQHLIPRLLAKARPELSDYLGNTGFPPIAGTGNYNSIDDVQRDVVREERMLHEIGRRSIPHLYLLDGDKQKGKDRLGNTKSSGRQIGLLFLERMEIENYLLDPSAIASAIADELMSAGSATPVLEDEVANHLAQLLDPNRHHDKLNKLYPEGTDGDASSLVKGSEVLRRIYDKYSLRYDKVKSGALLVGKVKISQSVATELNALLDRIVDQLKGASL